MEYALNPLTKRRIKIGSQLYRTLVKRGIIIQQNVNINVIENKIKQPKVPREGYVINPKTGREIEKSKSTYLKLLKAGVKFYDNDIPHVPINTKINRSTCKNNETFILFSSIADLDDEDFIMHPSGYCFSLNELINWLKSSNFNNRNPHVITETMFDEKNTSVWDKYPELSQLISKYFKTKQEERFKTINVVKENLDILYKIGDVGRICYWDNIYSHNAKDSSEFEQSINALGELAEIIDNLPAIEKNIFSNLKSNSGVYSVSKIIKNANEGTQCIHAIGISLLHIFISNIILVESMMKSRGNTSFVYDPRKCGLYFITKDKNIVVYNSENRLVVYPSDNNNLGYYERHFKNVVESVHDNNNSSLVWKMEKIRSSGLSPLYKETCVNDEPYQVTVNSSDEWSELEEWRKIKLSDGYCFDILYLIITMTNQLNTAKSTNPSPIYPYNVFTGVIYNMKDLIAIKRRIANNYLNTAPCLAKFLFNPEMFWSEDIVYVKSKEWMQKTIDVFEKELRFKRYIEMIEAGGNPLINGTWVKKLLPVENKESKLIKYLQTANVEFIRGFKPEQINKNYYYSTNSKKSSMSHGYNDKRDIFEMS